MSLYDLRKKYQLLFSALPDEIDLLMRKKIIEILDEEIAEIESRVSQLEKEEGRLLHNKNRSAYWEARSRIHELRGVLGKI